MYYTLFYQDPVLRPSVFICRFKEKEPCNGILSPFLFLLNKFLEVELSQRDYFIVDNYFKNIIHKSYSNFCLP